MTTSSDATSTNNVQRLGATETASPRPTASAPDHANERVNPALRTRANGWTRRMRKAMTARHAPSTTAEKQLDAVQVFQGIDSVTNDAKSGLGTGGPIQTANGTVNARFTVSTDASSFYESIGVSVHAACKSPTVKVSAKASFASSVSLTEFSTVLLAQSVVAEVSSGTGYNLPPDIASGLNAGSLSAQQFVLRMGDSFVDQITLGSAYYGVFVFQCTSSEEQMSIAAKLRASCMQGSASVSTAINQIATSNSTQIQQYQAVLGYNAAVLPAPNPQAMIDFTNAFNSLALNSTDKTILDFSTTGYENAVTFPGAYFNQVIHNRQLFLPVASYNDKTKQGWMQNYADMSLVLESADYVQGYYSFYGNYQDANLSSAVTALEATQDAINDNVGVWVNNATATLPAIDVSCVNWGCPALAYVPMTYTLYGSSQGPTTFNGPDLDRALQSFSSILEMKVTIANRKDHNDTLSLFSWTLAIRVSGETSTLTFSFPKSPDTNNSQTADCTFGSGDWLLSVLLGEYSSHGKNNISEAHFCVQHADGSHSWYGWGGADTSVQWWSGVSNYEGAQPPAPNGKIVTLLSFGGTCDDNSIRQLSAIGFYFNDATWSGSVQPTA